MTYLKGLHGDKLYQEIWDLMDVSDSERIWALRIIPMPTNIKKYFEEKS